jgi:uncharacterized protein (DUF1697 family)
MDTSYLALLRGVNVGGNKRVVMADLRALLTSLGYRDVRTHINSGNALFTSTATSEDRLAGQIERGIEAELGVSVRCVVRSRDALRRVVEANPLAGVATDAKRLLVVFLSVPADPARLAAIDPAGRAPEVFAAGRREIYLWLANGFQQATISPVDFERALRDPAATARNWNTVTRLLSMLG